MAYLPPLDGVIRVTSVFGLDRGSYRHGGLDLALQRESVYRRPVKAPAAGTIAAVWTTDRPSTRAPLVRDGFPYGNAVALRDDAGVLWRLLHFDEPPAVRVGQRVAAGETLGLCDSTGNSTGHHLHVDASPLGVIDPATFRVRGARVDPLRLYAAAYARDAGYAPEVFRRQITVESDWNPVAVSRAGAEGLAQIIPRWHPAMRGRTFDPFAALDYAARLMAAHLDHRNGDYREALADYNTGRESSGAFRAQGTRYADTILEGLDMARTAELEALRRDRDANHNRKLAALGHLGEVIQAARRAGETAFRPQDWRLVMTAERFYHDPMARE
jgi:soluble lytic murein transglycosylase-like protein